MNIGPPRRPEPEVEELATLRVQCLVLLQSLADYAPNLRAELEMPTEVPSDVGCMYSV